MEAEEEDDVLQSRLYDPFTVLKSSIHLFHLLVVTCHGPVAAVTTQ